MIAGVATDTIVVSTRIMKKPRHSANSAGHGSLSSVARRADAGECGGVGHGQQSTPGHGQCIP